MRNLLNIDTRKNPYELNYTNCECMSNTIELLIYIENITSPYLEFTKVDGSVVNSDVLTPIDNYISYSIPFSYYSTSGTLKVRVRGTDYDSNYISFTIQKNIVSSDNVMVKIDNGKYLVRIIAPYKYHDLPIASKTSLGGIIVGNNLSISPAGVLSATGGGSGGTGNYNDLTNKPTINGIELSGNKSTSDLGIDIPTKTSELTNDSGYLTGYTETDPIFSASAAADITNTDISNWNNKSNFSGSYNDLTDKPTIPNYVAGDGINISNNTISNAYGYQDKNIGVFGYNVTNSVDSTEELETALVPIMQTLLDKCKMQIGYATPVFVLGGNTTAYNIGEFSSYFGVYYLADNNLSTTNFTNGSFVLEKLGSDTTIYEVVTSQYSEIEQTPNVRIVVVVESNTVKSVGFVSNNADTLHVLATDVDYIRTYTPLYNGSPATKKYVDDEIITANAEMEGYFQGELDLKQDNLVSGTNIKTINNQSVLGSGNIDITLDETDPVFEASPAATITNDNINSWNNKSDFSGSYNDLTNKPDIPTKTSELTNDSGFVTSDYHDSTKQDTLTAGTNITIDENNVISATGGGSGGTGNYNDLTNKPVINITNEDNSNPTCLYDLDEGIYKIYGYIKYYPTDTGTTAITSPTLMTISKSSTTTYVQMFEPYENKITGYEITNSNYTTKTLNSDIVESGSNSNGSYIKYSDGTMECTKTVSGTVQITEQYYGYFYHTPDNKYFNLGDYAMPFIERPICSITFRGGNCQWIGAIQNQSATHVGDLQILSVTSKTAGAYYDIIAIGKWK